jgi:hypothetical protein
MPRTIATTTTVDREGPLALVRPRHQMLVITQRSDGRPQASPVTGGVDETGRIVISDEYRQAMLDQGKSILRITPTRWSPVATGGFPARLAD